MRRSKNSKRVPADATVQIDGNVLYWRVDTHKPNPREAGLKLI